MDQSIRAGVEAWFAAHREEITRQVMRFVSVPSITRYDEPGYAYGSACHEAMDLYEQTAQSMGFATRRFGDDVVTAALGADAGKKTIGLWSHLDVVPPGNGWLFSPFEPVCEQGYIIGRGADDNKSSAVGVLYMLRCLRELNVPLGCNVQAFCGCDEECGSLGVSRYAASHACPDFSIVPDCGFPVCYGEKGIINVTFRALRPLSAAFEALEGGEASNVIPDTARAVLRRTQAALEKLPRLPETVSVQLEEDRVVLTAHGTSGHAAFPQGAVNAVQALVAALAEAQLGEEADQEALRFLNRVNQDCFGTGLNIAMEDAESGRLSCSGTVLRLKDGVPSLTANIRYCVTADSAALRARMSEAAAQHGFEIAELTDSAPNFFPPEQPVVQALTEVYHQMTGDAKQPYVMSGGTYARKLPNALGFGIGSMPHERCPRIPEGHGGAHQPDETLHIDSYLKALTILTMGVLEADRCLCTPLH